MKRMRNSVKALIISLCVVVILAGSIIGVVLATRNKGKDPDKPTNPVEPAIKYELTEDQKNLMASINKNATTSVEEVQEFDSSEYVVDGGGSILLEDMRDFGDKYVVRENSDETKSLFIASLDANQDVVYKDIFDVLNFEGNIVYSSCIVCQNDYASLVYVVEDENVYTANFVLVDISNPLQVSKDSIVKAYVVDELDSAYEDVIENYFYDISTELCYFMQYQENASDGDTMSFVIFAYDDAENDVEVKNFSVDDLGYLSSDEFLFYDNETAIVGKYNGTSLVSKTYAIENLEGYKFLNNYFVAETFEEVEDPALKTPLTVGYKNYSYYVYDMTSAEQPTKFDLTDDYAKATFNNDKTNDFFYVFEQKLDESGKLLNSGLMTYYDYNFSKVVQYEVKSSEDIILYSTGSNILTKSGIISTQKSVNAEYLLKFENCLEGKTLSLYSETVNNNTYVLSESDSSNKYIYDMNGKQVFEYAFSKLYSFDEGYYIGTTSKINNTSDEQAYLLNTNTKTFTLIENFDYSKNNYLFAGGSYYFEKVVGESSTTYQMYNYKGVLIYDEIKKVSYSNYAGKTFIVLTFATKDDVLINTQMNFSFNEAVEEPAGGDNYSQSIELYSEGIATYTKDYKVDDDSTKTVNIKLIRNPNNNDGDRDFDIFIKAPIGYYPSSGKIALLRDGINTGNAVVSFSATINYNFDTMTKPAQNEFMTENLSSNMMMEGDNIVFYIHGDIDSSAAGYSNEASGIGEVSITLEKLKYNVVTNVMAEDSYYGGYTDVANYTSDLDDYNQESDTKDYSSNEIIYYPVTEDYNCHTILPFYHNYNYVRYNYCMPVLTCIGATITKYSYLKAPFPAAVPNETDGGFAPDAGGYSFNYRTLTTNYDFSFNYVNDVYDRIDIRDGDGDGNIDEDDDLLYERFYETKEIDGINKFQFKTYNVYAIYEPITYNISYDFNGTYYQEVGPTELKYAKAGGDNDFKIQNPVRDGYTFAGWNITGMDDTIHWWGGVSNENESATGVKVTSGFLNLTSVHGSTVKFTATWKANTYKLRFVFGEVDKDDNDSARLLLLSDFDEYNKYQGNYNVSYQTFGQMYAEYQTEFDFASEGYCVTETARPTGWYLQKPNYPYDEKVLLKSTLPISGNGEIQIDGSETNQLRTAISDLEYYKFWYGNTATHYYSPMKLKPFSFVYNSSHSFLNNKLYGYQEYFNRLDPNEENTFAFSVYNIPYQIKGWAFKTSTNDNDFQLLSSGNYDLIQYFNNLGKNSGSGAVIDLYAVYEPRTYEIYSDSDDDHGQGALKTNENIQDLNNKYVNIDYTIQRDTGKSGDDQYVNAVNDQFTLHAFDSPIFRLKIDNPDGSTPYLFDRIEITNFGYKTSATADTYSFAQIVITNKVSDEGSVLVAKVYGSSGNELTTDLIEGYYFIRTGAVKTTDYINGFKYTSNVIDEDQFIYLYFSKLGYAGDKNTKEISANSVNGDGTFGFTIKAYFNVYYTENHAVELNSETSSGEFLSMNVTPVYVENRIDSMQKTFNFFWLNGYRFTLVDTNEEALENPTAGYYELSIKSNSYVEHQPSGGGEYKIDEIKFVSYKAKLLDNSAASNFGKTGNRTIVYFEAFESQVDSGVAKDSNNTYLQSGNIYYFGGGDSWADKNNGVTVLTQALNYTNYNSSQFIAITPTQSHVDWSQSPNDSTVSNWYELKTYLTEIVFENGSFAFTINKNLVGSTNEPSKKYYDMYLPIIDLSNYTGSVSRITVNGADDGDFDARVIDYCGDKYVTKQAYKFSTMVAEKVREFALYFAIRESDNHVMYFLYSNVGDSKKVTITFKFAEVSKTITTIVSDVEKYGENEGTDKDGVDATAIVEYYKSNLSSIIPHEKTTENGTVSVNKIKKYVKVDGDNRTTFYKETINANDLRVIKISPTDGFMIQSISVKLGNVSFMNFSLNTMGLVPSYGDINNSYHTFVNKQGTEGSYTFRYLFEYTYLANYYFESKTSDDNKYYGIYYSVTGTTDWIISNGNPGFETIYLLVGGIYQAVQIDIVTASYIEFNYEDSQNVLEASDANNRYDYDVHAKKYVNSSDGNLLLNLVDVSSALNNGRDRYTYDGTSYAVDNVNGIYINYDGATDYQILYVKEGSDFREYNPATDGDLESGVYVIKNPINFASNYKYTKLEGSSYYLSSVQNLSMLVKNDEGDWIKLGLDYGLYDASLVKKQGDYLRVIFIGKKSIFANGVAIFASGTNYSVYFTNGYVYNDDGNDAKGLYKCVDNDPTDNKSAEDIHNENGFSGNTNNSFNGKFYTAFQFLSDVEGRHEDAYYAIEGKEESDKTLLNSYTPLIKNKETHATYGSYYSDITISNYLTYMQINNLEDFFKYSDKDRQGLGFEFAEKYYFSMSVDKNEITMNVNSFISNDNLKTFQAQGTAGEADYKDADEVKNDAIIGYYAEEPSLRTEPDEKNITSSVINNNTLVLKADNRNLFASVSYESNKLTGFAQTVVNGISNYQLVNSRNGLKQASPYMWIGENIYQIDYVNTTEGREYNKAQSWFNDTVLTNIDYSYYNENNASTDVHTNWQNINKYYQDAANGNQDPNHKVTGYEISYTYKAIPGYYLEYIIIETVEHDILYIPASAVDSLDKKVPGSDTTYVLSGQVATNGAKRIHYYLEHVIDKVNGVYEYTLRLYDNSNDDNGVSAMNSIGILSNNITVSFFSMAYNIVVEYNTNNDCSNISSASTEKINKVQETLIYDTLGNLTAIASMTGYTFVGWGSQMVGDNDEDYRFDKDKLKWSSYSYWIPVTGVSYPKSSTSYKNINYFDHNNRDSLIEFCSTSHGYDFYVKSSDQAAETNRANTTGYFITDTGYSAGNAYQENYNFWSVYANVFFNSVKSISKSSYNIELYAVWKANVYSTEFYINDYSISGNGSTGSSMAFRLNATDDLQWNNTIDSSSGTKYGVTLAAGSLANKITYSVTSTIGDSSSSEQYYCYVTFDKNDWYLISASDSNSNLIGYSNKVTTDSNNILKFIDNYNMLNYVIDRYGYSWLGWFSKDFENAYEGKDLASDAASRLVYGSDYYYTKTGGNSAQRKMPYLRYDTYTLDTDPYVKLGDFTGSQTVTGSGATLAITDVYSEFVYKGEKYFNDLYVANRTDNKYVYHYDYKSLIENDGNNIYFENDDYLNAKSGATYEDAQNGPALVYYDTSITLDAYKINGNTVDIERVKADAETGAVLNYRFVTLYAYWLTNNYKVVIDYRDENSVSINNVGSTDVTNVADIEDMDKSEFVDENDNTGTSQKSINSTYFDDDFFDYILNMSIPERVGYDFMGWSFFFRDPDIYSSEVDKSATGGELYKYNGLTYASSTYTLNATAVNSKYYYKFYNENLNKTEVKSSDIFALYTSAGLNMIDDNNYVALNENLETYGDKEGDGNHHIYIFALWRAQSFTINVGLNIDTENLMNSYDKDSSYSIAFYEDANAAADDSTEITSPSDYTGINSLFLKQKQETQNIETYADVYAEVVSNLTFVIKFDELFTTAMFKDPNTEVTKYYYLKDLFAVSAGYYFIGWLYKSDDVNSKLIANTLQTEFGYGYGLENNYELGEQTILSDVFNEEWYNQLYNSNYKNMTGVTLDDSSKFEAGNTKALHENDYSGNSSHFGYVTISGKNYYIMTEYNDNSGDYVSDTHRLFFRYNGNKYYVKFYNKGNGAASANVILNNDFDYLYYPGSSGNYVVRFDSTGAAYYVPNTTYKGKVSLDNLNIAIYASLADYLESVGVAGNNIASTLIDEHGLGFKMGTTRQFTVYADWQVKDDFVISFRNGNSGVYESEPNVSNNISNKGLAGFTSLYNYNDYVNSILQTQTIYDVGGGNTCDGDDIDGTDHIFTFYDSFGFDLLPYYNGRFISKLYIDFDRIESSSEAITGEIIQNSASVVNTYSKVEYRILIEFKWNSENHTPEIITVKLLKYGPDRDANTGELLVSTLLTCTLTTYKNARGISIIQIDNNNPADAIRLMSYLSVIDNDSFTSVSEAGIPTEGLFKMSSYNNNTGRDYTGDGEVKNEDLDDIYGRRDVNMLSFDLNDLLSSVRVSFEYSVQTYQLDINHIFDEKGDTLIQMAGGDGSIFTSEITDIDAAGLYNAQNSLHSNEVYADNAQNGANSKLATIPINLGANSYNVPYGYFIYGDHYDSELEGFRPMDDYHKDSSRTNTFDGFNYIYSEGNYSKGASTTDTLKAVGTDLYYNQGSPILGSASTFPTKSIRLSRSFYLFKGFFEYAGKTGSYVQFDLYNKEDEGTFISRNITLYAYYFSNNTPTNIQFYTWNNDWNENSPTYLPYKNNSEEYTLSSSEENSAYKYEGGYLIPNESMKNIEGSKFVDDEGKLIFASRIEHGIDFAGFNNNDRFSTFELPQGEIGTLEIITKTYWYYEEIYKLLSANIAGVGDVYLKYDQQVATEYCYVPEVPTAFISGYDTEYKAKYDGIIVNRSEYEQFKLSNFTYDQVTILAWVDLDVQDKDGDGVINLEDTNEDGVVDVNNSTITYKGTSRSVELKLSNIDNEYWFYDEEVSGLYYYITVIEDELTNVKSQITDEKDAFYYEYYKNVSTAYSYVADIPDAFKSYSDYDPKYNGMIVNKKEYNKYIGDSLSFPANTVTVYAWVDLDVEDVDGDGVVDVNNSTITYKGTDTSIELNLSDVGNEYYFYDQNVGLYYYITVNGNAITNIITVIPNLNKVNTQDYDFSSANHIIQKVKINVSQNMTSANIILWKDSGYPALNDAELLPLTIEDVYVYNKRFIGAELYALVGNGDDAKYYKYNRTDDTMFETDFLRKFKPRYYIDYQGMRYYTFLTINESNQSDTKDFLELYTKDGDIPSIIITKTLTTLNNYFVILDDVYYEIEFAQITDNRTLYTHDGSNYNASSDYIYKASTSQIVNAKNTSTVIADIDLNLKKIKFASETVWIDLNYNSDTLYYSFMYNEVTYYLGSVDSTYVNPLLNASLVELPYDDGNSEELTTKIYYFDYTNNSKNTGLYESFEQTKDRDGKIVPVYSDWVLFDYNIYTPINANYSVHPVVSGTSWVTSDTTINTFPSLNMDYWYSNPDYVLLGYLDVRDDDINAMKRSESGETSDSIYMFVKDLNQIVVKAEYISGGAFSVFADVDIANKRITLSSGEALILIEVLDENDDATGKYYFSYQDGKYYFNTTDATSDLTIEYDKAGGQIDAAFVEYIKTKYPGDISDLLLTAVRAQITDFKLDNLLKYPMYVEKYTLSTSDFKTIKSVDVRITVQFVLDNNDINAVAGLLALCQEGGIYEDLAVKTTENGVDSYSITISTTFLYTFDIITTSTLIDSNIYAIPAYVPDVIKFVDADREYDSDSDTETFDLTGSITSINGDVITIDFKKMNVTHFDLSSFKMYNADFIWDADDAKIYDNDEVFTEDQKNKLINGADYLQFVVLTESQYNDLKASTVGLDVKLDTIIAGESHLRTSDDLLVKSLGELTRSDLKINQNTNGTEDIIGQPMALDMSWWTGDDDYSGNLYIVAFYYGIGTCGVTTQYVFNITNDKGTVTSSNILTRTQLIEAYKVAYPGMTETELNNLTEEQLISFAENAKLENGKPQFGTLTEIRYNKHINRVSDNVLVVNVQNGEIVNCPTLETLKTA